MKRLPFALSTACAAIVLLTSCVALRTTADDANAHTFRFNHNVTNRAGVGVLRAFDDRSKTVIQFVDIERQKPEIFDKAGEKVPYNTVGQYAIINGTPAWFMIKVHGETSIVTNLDPAPTRAAAGATAPPAQTVAAAQAMPAAAQVAVASPVAQPKVDAAPTADKTAGMSPGVAVPALNDAEREQLKTELNRTLAELAALRKQIEQAKANPTLAANIGPISDQITTFSAKIRGLDSQVMRISFNYEGTDFKPSSAEVTFLLPTAREAKVINLRGRTDSKVANQADRSIARARALAAQKFLIENGIAANKIRVYYTGAGLFVADNRTPEGRTKNRRVEIELVGATTATANAARRDADRVAQDESAGQKIAMTTPANAK